MKVLFIASGNSENFGISPIIINQGESLKKEGVDIHYFAIKGRGYSGYIKNIFPLRKFIKSNHFDVVHAHYGMSGWVTFLTFTGIPLVVSFMGSDAYGDVTASGRKNLAGYIEMLLSKILQFFIDKIIAKSENIAAYIDRKKKVTIIPNGVNIEKFFPDPSRDYKSELGLDRGKKYILFMADKDDPRKNFKLIKDAFNNLNEKNCEILCPFPAKHDEVPAYLNASDVVALTSYLEGSPNIIKEAMACNCPIVSTDAGDVKSIIDGVDGCFLCSFDPRDAAEKIKKALEFPGRTKGREKILAMGLDQKSVAEKIIKVYTDLINNQ
jgi:teichuronic acid biosynthesis glycosyltransferase TuaC